MLVHKYIARLHVCQKNGSMREREKRLVVGGIYEQTYDTSLLRKTGCGPYNRAFRGSGQGLRYEEHESAKEDIEHE